MNTLHQRVYLAGMGIAGVGMGVVIAMGLTMLMGFFYTPLHGVMVYLCLGTVTHISKCKFLSAGRPVRLVTGFC